MSTFNGYICEISGISVDRFTEGNIDAKAFFLSHFHTDHMVGLDSPDFENNILTKNLFLYGSDVTVLLLQQRYPRMKTQFKALSTSEAALIPIGSNILTVTLLPAGHCPGSVMFLFETNDIRVLYTGDFRIAKSDVSKFKQLHDGKNSPKRIDKIYLDTTFLSTAYETFPLRKDSTTEICRIIRNWTSQGKDFLISLSIPARYGSENLFISIYKATNYQIHVDEEFYNVYKCIPEMCAAITTDTLATPIHVSLQKAATFMDNTKVKFIKPCALFFEGKYLSKGIVHENGRMTRVCYSCHSSYEEIKDFVEYLKPSAIHACVVPSTDPARKHMEDLIQSMLVDDTDTLIPPVMGKSDETATLKRRGWCFESTERLTEDSDSDLFDSPPRKCSRDNGDIK